MSATADILPTDEVLLEIADYVDGYVVTNDAAYDIARYCLMDSLACALEALDHPGCTALLGPAVPGISVTHGARVPGTGFLLDPVTAAFNIACMIRWLDYSDTWVTNPTTTHPSDDVGAILSVADYLSRVRTSAGQSPLTIASVLEAIIKAHELQGRLGADLALTEHGIDHVFLTKIACAAVVTRLLGGSHAQIVNATSLAFFDVSLCLHRYGTNTGPRKGWAGADATSHAVRLALMAMKDEPGYPQVVTHPKFGFLKSFLGGEELQRKIPFGSGVMENVFFKLVGPVVIHAQSAIECALQLHPLVQARLDEIAGIRLVTHKITIRNIDKRGPLRNSADRDHCLQYAVAVALLFGRLTANHYEDEVAADPRIDRLRSLMSVSENPRYTEMYLDPELHANPNAIEISFKDGTGSGLIEVQYPLGHSSRRNEGLPLLIKKFEGGLARRFAPQQQRSITEVCLDQQRLMKTPVHTFTELFVV